MSNSIESVCVKSKILAYYEKYMLFIGIVGQLLYYLQAVKIFSSMSADGVSLPAFCLGGVSVLSWYIYGILIGNKPLIISNLIAVIGASLVIIGIVLYS